MRFKVALLLLSLWVLPRQGFADTIDIFAAESRIEYDKFSVLYNGLSLYHFSVQTPRGQINADFLDGWFDVYSDAFIEQTIETDSVGEPIGSYYLFGPGTFHLDVQLRHPVTGQSLVGSLSTKTGPIEIFVDEYGEIDDEVEIFFPLGSGLLSESLAKAFRISRHVEAGKVSDPFLIFGDGDPFSDSRTAWEGAPQVALYVAPEPVLLALFGTAAVGFMAHCRRRKGQKVHLSAAAHPSARPHDSIAAKCLDSGR